MNKTEKSEQERKLAAGTEAQVSKLPIHQLPVQPVSPSPSTSSSIGLGIATEQKLDSSNNLAKSLRAKRLSKDGVGAALSDTPLPSAPSSPKMWVTVFYFLKWQFVCTTPSPQFAPYIPFYGSPHLQLLKTGTSIVRDLPIIISMVWRILGSLMWRV
jgi:hypothetical protein